MPLAQLLITMLVFGFVGFGLTGCSTPKDRPSIAHVTLPNREVQATLAFAPRQVHQAAERCLRNELGYSISAAEMNNTTGEGRIDATNSDGESVRVETMPGPAYQSAIVQVFAVPAGSRAGDVERAGVILDRIADTLHGVIR
jgi:hypothetical protein